MAEQGKVLGFGDFCRVCYDFAYRKRVLVFIICPLILELCLFLIGYCIEGSRFWPKTSQERKDFWGSLLFPFALSAMAYIVLYGNTGNHPAKGNENAFGCALMMVLLPVLAFAYSVYRLVRLGLDLSRSKMNHGDTKETIIFEERVKLLNDLLNAGVISKSDYDEQLSRVVKSVR